MTDFVAGTALCGRPLCRFRGRRSTLGRSMRRFCGRRNNIYEHGFQGINDVLTKIKKYERDGGFTSASCGCIHMSANTVQGIVVCFG